MEVFILPQGLPEGTTEIRFICDSQEEANGVMARYNETPYIDPGTGIQYPRLTEFQWYCVKLGAKWIVFALFGIYIP